MHKKIITSILFLLTAWLPTSIWSQSMPGRKLRLGVQAGPNLTFVVVPHDPNFYSIRPKIGLDGNLAALVPISDHFGLQFGVGYTQLRYRVKETDFTSSLSSTDRYLLANYADNILYFTPLARISVGQNFEKLFFTAGPVLEYYVGYGYRYGIYEGNQLRQSGSYFNRTQDLWLSATISAGYNIPLSASTRLSVEPYFCYHHFDFSNFARFFWKLMSTGLRIGFWI